MNKHPEMGMSADNFSFAKARVSYDPEHETVRAAVGGRGLNPIKNSQTRHQLLNSKVFFHLSLVKECFHWSYGNIKAAANEDEEDANANNGFTEADTPEEVRGRSGRRSIQPPKRYATAEFVPEPQPKRARVSQKASQDR